MKPLITFLLKHLGRFGTCSLAAFLLAVGTLSPVQAQTTHASQQSVVQAYAKALSHVQADGRVDYLRLKQNRSSLDAYIKGLETFGQKNYNQLSSSEKIAFWINAYNALTLESIIDHYPISSIKKIPAVWSKRTHFVMGKKYSLDDIEHQILRKNFKEPRIHMALVCASKGCPILLNQPYTGSKLNQQLNQQTRRFLSDHSKFKINARTIYISSIFKWYGQDFVQKFAPPSGFSGSKKEKAVLNFIHTYLSAQQQSLLKQGKYKLKYLSYDWSLNGL